MINIVSILNPPKLEGAGRLFRRKVTPFPRKHHIRRQGNGYLCT
jgi:hypothetical protein